jgi:hypothetical protein
MPRTSYPTCLLLLAVYGCSMDADPEAAGPQPDPLAGHACELDNLTEACSCAADVRGRRTCQNTTWGSCQCRTALPTSASNAGAGAGGSAAAPGGGPALTSAASDPAANRSTTRFDWQRTVPSGGSCEAGHYEGTFDGWYGPSIIVVADLKVIPVFPVELPGNPGLAFDLNREGTGEVFTVSNGKLNGNALGAFPITADIEGKLDCTTLKFDAKLVRGSYFIGPLEYTFEGPITADYDKLTHTLVNGNWMVTEPDYPTAGGMGTWTVQWLHN